MGETITPEELRKSIADKEKVTVIDVRRKADFEADSQVIPGAVHKDPEQVEEWSKDLGYGQDIVVYCVRGGSVSKSVSEKLRARKVKVRFIEGGIEAWKESGGDTQEKI